MNLRAKLNIPEDSTSILEHLVHIRLDQLANPVVSSYLKPTTPTSASIPPAVISESKFDDSKTTSPASPTYMSKLDSPPSDKKPLSSIPKYSSSSPPEEKESKQTSLAALPSLAPKFNKPIYQEDHSLDEIEEYLDDIDQLEESEQEVYKPAPKVIEPVVSSLSQAKESTNSPPSLKSSSFEDKPKPSSLEPLAPLALKPLPDLQVKSRLGFTVASDFLEDSNESAKKEEEMKKVEETKDSKQTDYDEEDSYEEEYEEEVPEEIEESGPEEDEEDPAEVSKSNPFEASDSFEPSPLPAKGSNQVKVNSSYKDEDETQSTNRANVTRLNQVISSSFLFLYSFS